MSKKSKGLRPRKPKKKTVKARSLPKRRFDPFSDIRKGFLADIESELDSLPADFKQDCLDIITQEEGWNAYFLSIAGADQFTARFVLYFHDGERWEAANCWSAHPLFGFVDLDDVLTFMSDKLSKGVGPDTRAMLVYQALLPMGAAGADDETIFALFYDRYQSWTSYLLRGGDASNVPKARGGADCCIEMVTMHAPDEAADYICDVAETMTYVVEDVMATCGEDIRKAIKERSNELFERFLISLKDWSSPIAAMLGQQQVQFADFIQLAGHRTKEQSNAAVIAEREKLERQQYRVESECAALRRVLASRDDQLRRTQGRLADARKSIDALEARICGASETPPPIASLDGDGSIDYLRQLLADQSDELRSARAQTKASNERFNALCSSLGRAEEAQQAIADVPLTLTQWSIEHEDAVVVLPRARNGAKKSIYHQPELMIDALNLLAGSYRDSKLGRLSVAELNMELESSGLRLARSVAPSVAGEQGDEYFVSWGGRRLFLDFHLAKGGGRDERYCFRLYFCWDQESRRVVVGSMPSHLSNSLS